MIQSMCSCFSALWRKVEVMVHPRQHSADKTAEVAVVNARSHAAGEPDARSRVILPATKANACVLTIQQLNQWTNAPNIGFAEQIDRLQLRNQIIHGKPGWHNEDLTDETTRIGWLTCLEIKNFRYLTSLPPGLSIEISLLVEDCVSLISLSDRLSVGVLYLRHCPALLNLSESVMLRGLRYEHCPKLTLPANLRLGKQMEHFYHRCENTQKIYKYPMPQAYHLVSNA